MPLRGVDRAAASLSGALLVFVLAYDGTVLLGTPLSDLAALRAQPPLWPPALLLEALGAWGRHCDLLLLYAPPHYRALAGVGVVLGVPFYTAAAWAFWRGGGWIRVPGLVFAGVTVGAAPLLVVAQLSEPYASPRPAAALAVQLPRWLLAGWLLVRLWRGAPSAASRSGAAS